MTWLYGVIGGALLVVEILLVYELRQTRKEMRTIRKDIPKWVGASMAITILIAALKKRSGDL